MATRNSFKLNKKAQANIIAYVRSRFQLSNIQSFRQRLERIDKAIQLESELRRKDRTDYFQDTEIAVLNRPIGKIRNFLIDTFISSPYVFEAFSREPQFAQAVREMNAINEENAAASDWVRELILYFTDLAKYPKAAMECYWEAEEAFSIATDSADGDQRTGAALKVVNREGNVLKRWDMYNTFHDATVPINKVHSKGEYAGHIERVSMVDLHQYLKNLKILGPHVMNEDDVWDCGSSEEQYYVPNVAPIYDAEESNTGWAAFFEGIWPTMPSTTRQTVKGRTYERITVYARIIPSMLGMNVPAKDRVQIWKFVLVNWNTLVYAERQSTAHGYIPAIFSQVKDEGIKEQSKSPAELLVPVQNLSTHLHDSRLASLKRAIGDRALYDSGRIDKKHVNSQQPDAKIPVKPSMLKGTIQDAYWPIPFNDSLAGSYYQEIGFLRQQADDTIGLNAPQQGMFQRGNKTLGEFNEVMSNANEDLRTIAKLIESTTMVPLKMIIKTNILQFQPPTIITSSIMGAQIQVNPVELRRTAVNFKLADGLIGKEEILDTQTAQAMLQLLLQVPELRDTYGTDLRMLVDQIFNSIRFDTSKFSNGGQGGQAPQGGGQPAAQPPAAPQAPTTGQ